MGAYIKGSSGLVPIATHLKFIACSIVKTNVASLTSRNKVYLMFAYGSANMFTCYINDSVDNYMSSATCMNYDGGSLHYYDNSGTEKLFNYAQNFILYEIT